MRRRKLVAVDPGHGGGDPGAIGPDGTFESDVALEVSAKLLAFLESDDELDGFLTHEGGGLGLRERAMLANSRGAAALVSIHCNSFAHPDPGGFEVWTSPGETQADKIADGIFAFLDAYFPDLRGREDTADGDHDKEARFTVLTRTVCPAVLVELAFISNPIEERLLLNPLAQLDFAEAIYNGIKETL